MPDPRPTTELPATSPDGFDPAPPRRPPPADPLPVIPGYDILGPIGKGGMGVVYMARQTVLNRVVALKTIHTEIWPDGSDRVRFLAEAEAVAAVDHPNVIRVYEYGEAGDRPYFAMEYVPGGSLAAKIATDGPLDPDAAAAVLAGVARGVQAVHDVGVIHRDLKPGNILLEGARGEGRGASRDSGGTEVLAATDVAPWSSPLTPRPKVTDFGLAKRFAKKGMTLTGLIVGTPVYMAPEQAAGRGRFVGPPADIYALGVVLYETLTGRVPFDSEDTAELLAMLRDRDPAPVRTHRPGVPADLDLICLKCLEKDPRGRYPTAAALADDLQRFLAREPVSVRPAGRVEKTARWVRRHPTRAALYAVTSAAAILLVLTAGAITLWRRAEEARTALGQALVATEAAKQATVEALAKEKTAHVRAEEALAREKTERAAKEAERAAKEAAEAKFLTAAAARAVDLAHREFADLNVGRARELLDGVPPGARAWEWRYVDRLCRRDVRTIRLNDPGVLGLAAHPDGKRVAVAGRDATGIWSLPAGVRTVSFNEPAHAVALSGDGARMAVALGGGFRVLSPGFPQPIFAGKRAVEAVRLNGDGSRAVTVGPPADRRVTVWDVAGKKEAAPLRLPGHAPVAADISPDGKWVAVGGAVENETAAVGSVQIVDAATGAPRATARIPSAGVRCVACDPAGAAVASGSSDGVVRVWDRQTGRLLASSAGRHDGDVRAVAWSRDGARLASAGADRTVRVWDAADGTGRALLQGHAGPVTGVAFTPAGQVLSAGEDGTLRVWDAAPPPPVWLRLPGRNMFDGAPFALGPGDRAVTGGTVAAVWDTRTGEVVVRLPEAGARAVGFNGDGSRVWTCTRAGGVREWDAATGREVGGRGIPGAADVAALTPGFSRAAARTQGGRVRVLDGRTGDVTADLDPVHHGFVGATAVSHGGMYVATGGDDRGVRVWEAAGGKPVAHLTGFERSVRSVAFSPDGTRLAAADGACAKVWDVATGLEVLTLRPPREDANRSWEWAAVGWSPDGSRLGVLQADGRMRTFDAGE